MNRDATLVLDAVGPAAAARAIPDGLPGALPGVARWFLAAVTCLLALGLVILFSATFLAGWRVHGDPTHFLQRQVIGVLIGGVALVVGMLVPARRWLALAPMMFVGVAALLALVLVIGVDRNGARRWFAVPGIGSLQPSELAKVALPLFVAWGLERLGLLRARRPRWGWREHALPCAVLGVAFLVILEPDYGTGLFLLGVCGILLLVAGVPRATLRIGILVLGVSLVAMFFARQEVMMRRLQALSDPRNQFQVDQSLIGIHGGGWLGQGLGLGLQKAMVPEHSTDFIVAVVGEELGVVGLLVLLGLLTLTLQSGAGIVRRCPDPALRLVALALVTNIVLQACVNIAVATASAPTKGIPLPFLSFGSSGLTVLMFEVGLLMSIARAPPLTHGSIACAPLAAQGAEEA